MIIRAYKMSDDTNFDKHRHRFRKNIYDTDKGRLRLDVVLKDLLENTPVLQNKQSISILDAGCGMGQVALTLAQQGHELTLCDISSEMLSIAQSNFEKQGQKATFYHTSLQDLDSSHDHHYDLIIFHAVLEWLEDPQAIIAELKKRLKPGGCISLMFYNLNSIIFYNLLKGNFRKVLNQDFAGHPGGLTPTNPINPEDLDTWLVNNQLLVIKKTGIRVFYDYLNKKLKDERSYKDILEMEMRYCGQQPFNMMARYVHYICQQTVK